MERLGTFQDAHAKVLVDAQRCMEKIRQLSARTFDTAEGGVRILQALRRETYEDLNQIQHEHTIVRAAQWLIAQEKCSQRTQWFWNPRQTGDATEPDLRGLEDGDVVVSAEITTSQNPVGVIDSRMRNTLAKLAEAEGARFYFVCTESMRQRAATKIQRAGWKIEVVQLSGSSDEF